jgi:cyclophilin family peptidyl-prolyl cis-trans isomerase
MTIRLLILLAVILSWAMPVRAQNDAAREYKEFQKLQAEWIALEQKFHNLQKAKAKDEELTALRAQSDKLLDQLVMAGLAVYKADPNAYPVVNETLRAVASFHVLGDPNGDGGDQYEKALPLIKSLIDAGAATDMPELWQLGAVSAYCTNDYELARNYLNKAIETGALNQSDRLNDLVQKFSGSFTATYQNWKHEELIRGAEKVADDLPRVKFTTSRGDIVIELFENEAPQAVANFLTLVKKGYYTNVPFHRVLSAFMAQGGDPTGTGSGGPGYSIRCECYGKNYRKHFRGSLSMAHAGRDTGGSQFFLTFVPTSYLDGKHTVFGRVIEGMDVAASLRRRDPDAGGPADKIVSAKVLRDRGHEYKFEKLPGR